MSKTSAATDVVDLLQEGDVDVLGLLPYSSNYVFLARVSNGGSETLAVYKPRRGETPLWDFPSGTLAAREVAAFVVGEAAGWDIVPPTVLRREAPLGPGSLQAFIDHDPERHYFSLMQDRLGDLAVFAAFDVVTNNADRKAGHVLEGPDGRLWSVDHGVTFHVEPKLRTVIWAFAEEPLGSVLRGDLERLQRALADDAGLGGRLTRLLSAAESAATLERVTRLLETDRFPPPGSRRHLPWPLI